MDIAMFWNRLLTGQEETVYSGGGIGDLDGGAGKDAEKKNKKRTKEKKKKEGNCKGNEQLQGRMIMYDVLVIGAGPAGSTAAKILADRGLSLIHI